MTLMRIPGFAAWKAAPEIPVYTYVVQRTYSHDPKAFTQGLQYDSGFLYEGTGLHGESSIRKVALETGKVIQRREVPAEHFGEGIVLWKSHLIQLTWQSQLGFVYDRSTFNVERTFSYTGEGWGLTHDGSSLIMSDGTSQLRFLDPETFAVRRVIKVTAGGVAVTNLNELEFVNGEIFANIWSSDRVARIAPLTGEVTGWIDLSGLLTPAERRDVDVLNGIAYDASGNRLFVTGKYWPKLFEIRIIGHR